MPKTVDEILKQLGDDVKYVNMSFLNGYSITFDNGIKKHISKGNDLISCAEDLYQWYRDSNSPKGVAESLYNIIDEIIGKAVSGKLPSVEGSNDTLCNRVDTMDYAKVFDEIIEIANKRDGIIHVVDGKLQWVEFDEEKRQELICENAKEEPKRDVKKAQPKSQPKEKPQPKKEIVSTDGYPLYFSVNTMNYAQTFCYGYNNDNERVYVKIDYVNPSDCEIKVGAKVPTSYKDDDIIEIAKDEFMFNLESAETTLMSVQQTPQIDPSKLYMVE